MKQKYQYGLPVDRTRNDNITRSAFARDASMYRILPKAVVRPKDEKEVQDLLIHANTHNESITFRTGGTSLSGQSITSGLLSEVIYDWQKIRILDDGKKVWCQPGVSGADVNRQLLSYGRKIGPDPASINVARIGGIISNNSSGMMCGTKFNAYHTLDSISFILANGNAYDSSNLNDQNRFVEKEKLLSQGLLSIKNQILNHPNHLQKIREKYRLKNTIGYSLNAFLDFDSPLDIFSHLLVGAEGTLGFISNVTLKTVPNPKYKGTGLILFNTPETAGASVPFFKEMGAAAVEFLDDSSLRTANNFKNPPYNPNSIVNDVTGLLIEFEHKSDDEIQKRMNEVHQFSKHSSDILNFDLVTDNAQRETLWKIRKGLYPTLGALRKSGTNVITEDIAVDVDQLATAIRELKSIFRINNFSDGVIFGHAKDGNLHFLTTVDLGSRQGLKNYEGLMNDLSTMTLDKFNGSLKAEHGTGRNMAPFVEAEWGGVLYEMMWQIKKWADPSNILNPDVLLSRDNSIHMSSLKKMPIVDDLIDKCIECGFCEKSCPSRGITLTPRQRISVLREIQSNPVLEAEMELFNYMFDETCATDGLCQLECPVNINTGDIVKSKRVSKTEEYVLVDFTSKRIKSTVNTVRAGLKIANIVQSVLGNNLMNSIISPLIKPFSKSKSFSFPKVKIPLATPIMPTNKIDYDYLIFPTCAGRVLASDSSGNNAVDYLIKISNYANVSVKVLEQFQHLCCGMSYESRGHSFTGKMLEYELISFVKNQNKNNEIPIIIDMSPCNEHLIQSNPDIHFIDSVEFLSDILPRVEIHPIQTSYYAHTVCSLQKANKSDIFINLVKACVSNVETAPESFCCGMGGDRLFRAHELPENSIQQSLHSIKSTKGVSSSRTCELALSENLNINFSSIESLVYHAIKK